MLRAVLLVSTLVLGACGGGGGGSGTGSTPIGSGGPGNVAINESNAKPVGANALDAAQNTSATVGVTGPTGVQSSASAMVPMSQAIGAINRRTASLPVGVAVSETDQCTLGGTVSISGNVSGASGPTAGDTLAITANNCSEPVGSSTMVTNGQMTMTFVSGTLSTLPFHVVIAVTTTNFSVQMGGITSVTSGDVRLDWTASSATSQTLVATGTTLTSRETIAGTPHTTTLRNYTQTVAINGTVIASSLNASVETDSSKIATTPVSYTIATTTPVTFNAATRTATAGAVHVTGAASSQLLLTINADSTVTIQVDANGDGTYEKTITTNTAELAGLV
ncbi:MAG TPA: hypothetical protein VMZ74_18140 [Ramlibacter sp.]|nr:hypothetical protein [Ramlibacter sp.]